MAGRYEVLSHTADTGVRVEADTWVELLEWAARSMVELMYDVEGCVPSSTVRLEVAAAGCDDQLVDMLAELLFHSEAHDVVPCRCAVVGADEHRVIIDVGTVPVGGVHLVGTPIKAVTYHGLVVEQRADGRWSAEIVFDV